MRKTALLLACALAACTATGETDGEDPAVAAAPTEDSAGDAAASGAVGLPVPQAGGAAQATGPIRRPVDPASVRNIYVAFEGRKTGTVSVIFAVDQDRSGTPTDDRAIRISPENSECNPQELTRYDFPAGTAPVFGVEQVEQGLTPAELPRFLAASVTGQMIARDLADDEDDTLPQNVCTRKLWELLAELEQQRAAAAGQQ